MPDGIKPIVFICVKWGEAYSAEYVNILKDMVSRNLEAGFPGRFVCMTDDPTGIDESIEILPIPDDLETWWGKLYMFKRGLFPDGTRCVFMDLDTVIIGSITDILKYDGKFAILRDVYFPQQLMSAIMLWEAGEYTAQIWDTWEAEGKPRDPRGDQWWINIMQGGRFAKNADVLQDLYPGKIKSFKADCKPVPPKGTSVVCFHGQPKPHNCGSDWIAAIWKIGGGIAEMEIIINTDIKQIIKNVNYSCSLDLPWLEFAEKHDEQIVLVGGGPSVKETIEEIRWRKDLGQKIMACNQAGIWLNQQGIVPDYQIIIDARPQNRDFMCISDHFLLASQCDPSLFAVRPITLFHMNTTGIEDILPKDKVANLISSGTTVGLAAMAVAYVMGYRTMHLHGYDSSFNKDHHAYSQPINDNDQVVEVSVQGETFRAAPWMVKQVQEWQGLVLQLADDGVIVTVAGHGLLPHVARLLASNLQGETNG